MSFRISAGFVIIIFFVFYSAFGDHKKPLDKIKKQALYSKKATLVFPKLDLLKNADIVFRRGYGVDSTVAMNFSEGEKRYSHAGIIYKKDGEFYVIHSEDDDKSHHNGIFSQSLKSFLDGSPIWAVYRLNLPDRAKQRIVSLALEFQKKDIKFDNDFDLNDDKKMYCSEFVYKVINRANKREIIHAGKQLMSRTFVTISDLYENKHTKLVQSSHKKIKD